MSKKDKTKKDKAGKQGKQGKKNIGVENKKSKFREKLDMYDMIIANMIAGNSIIEPTQELDNSQLAIGFSNISSQQQLTKYFVISKFPDYMKTQMIDTMRKKCMRAGLKINFYFYAEPHRINWDSPEMRNRMVIWRRYSAEHSGQIDVFSYRTQRGEAIARQRIIQSTKYLNEAELEYKRSFMRVIFVIEISAKRDEESLANMADSIQALKDICYQSDIKIQEMRINMIDWVRGIGPFCLSFAKEIYDKLSKKVVTDDILANFNQYSQGRIGIDGVPLGMDILNGVPVMYKFKRDPDQAENWLISAATGGGKSMWLKSLLIYLLAENIVGCVMDYEGDEYTNIANYIRADRPDDVKIVSMGAGSTVYFDPCEIPDLTGDPKVDDDLKKSAIGFITSVFRVIVCGDRSNFSRAEERVISLAIQRMYDTVGVTEDKETWHRSKGLRLRDIYYEIKQMVDTKELVDNDTENLKHRAAVSIMDSASVYFEQGEAKFGTFETAMSANELYKAKLIVFSFGMKGASESQSDPTLLALKQLSVAYVNISISNYCKYVKHCFNVKVWEEYQRWIENPSSAPIINNSITGGRKRGDINFIITNDLGAILDDDNELNKKLRLNIQNYVIGKIPDQKVREQFVDKFDVQDVQIALDTIAKAHSDTSSSSKVSGAQSRYKYSFCIVLESGKKAIVKSMLPKALLKSKLFSTGVQIQQNVQA